MSAHPRLRSRLSVSGYSAARSGAVRPTVMANMMAIRHASSSKPAPQDQASSILSKLPLGTGTVVLGTSALAAATSMELFVLNEEVV